MSKIRSGLIVMLALLLQGCHAEEVFISPPLNAIVLDKATGAPLEGVVVTMWSVDNPAVTEVGVSSGKGAVALPRLKGVLGSAFPFVVDRVPPKAIARFEHPGYNTLQIDSDNISEFLGRVPVEMTKS
jgi:hypothetical protein